MSAPPGGRGSSAEGGCGAEGAEILQECGRARGFCGGRFRRTIMTEEEFGVTTEVCAALREHRPGLGAVVFDGVDRCTV